VLDEPTAALTLGTADAIIRDRPDLGARRHSRSTQSYRLGDLATSAVSWTDQPPHMRLARDETVWVSMGIMGKAP